jgi:hypothetical protein
MTEKMWRIIYKMLRFAGFAGCATTFLLLTALTGYYSANRPHVPQPEREWTVQLYWSVAPPSYGTVAENELLLTVFWSGIVFFLVIAIGEAIRIYKLGGWRKQ